MRKPVLYALIALVVVLAAVAIALFVNFRKVQTDYADMKVREETARVGYSEAFTAISEIQDSLNTISAVDTTVRMMSGSDKAEMKATEGVRRQALERIALLNASLQRNKDRIRRLEANLKRSGVHVAALEKALNGLKQSVAEKEAMIASLSAQVDTLHTQVTGLQTQVTQGQDTIRERERALEQQRHTAATIYYIVGTKTELTKAGVVDARGGLLGIGKTLGITAKQDESRFTALDTDLESVVHTPAAKVQVLSPQPAASYELQLVDGRMELHVLNPAEFRKVKYLVIMTR
jgi:peptidoglycan hydrolase CwlO-like protein